MPIDTFNQNNTQTGTQYVLLFNQTKADRDGHNIAILKDGRHIPYTDMPTKNTYDAMEGDDPLVGIQPAAIVTESDIEKYDLSFRTDLPSQEKARQIVFNALNPFR